MLIRFEGFREKGENFQTPSRLLLLLLRGTKLERPGWNINALSEWSLVGNDRPIMKRERDKKLAGRKCSWRNAGFLVLDHNSSVYGKSGARRPVSFLLSPGKSRLFVEIKKTSFSSKNYFSSAPRRFQRSTIAIKTISSGRLFSEWRSFRQRINPVKRELLLLN